MSTLSKKSVGRQREISEIVRATDLIVNNDGSVARIPRGYVGGFVQTCTVALRLKIFERRRQVPVCSRHDSGMTAYEDSLILCTWRRWGFSLRQYGIRQGKPVPWYRYITCFLGFHEYGEHRGFWCMDFNLPARFKQCRHCWCAKRG